jgi:hypothetical protein
MEFNRNQYFMAGLVVFLLGVQFRMVDAFVLNERATQFKEEWMPSTTDQQLATAGQPATFFGPQAPIYHRLEPPNWLGWSFVSVGSVLVLYSLALKKPAG